MALLPNILGKQQARDADAFEAWQVDEEGYVRKGLRRCLDSHCRRRSGDTQRQHLHFKWRDPAFRARGRDRAGIDIMERPFTPKKPWRPAGLHYELDIALKAVTRIDGHHRKRTCWRVDQPYFGCLRRIHGDPWGEPHTWN